MKPNFQWGFHNRFGAARAVFYAVLAATASRLAVRARAAGRHHRNDDLQLPLRRPWVLVSTRIGQARTEAHCPRQLEVREK